MELDPLDRVVIFIDGANLYATAKAIGIDVDYRSMLADFRKKCRFIRAYYFTAYLDDQEYSSIRPLIDWLDYNGYTMITKPAKEFTDAAGRKKIKGNMDIEIAVEALELAPYFDHMVLFSGDGDFTSLVKSLQRKAKKVTVVSTLSTATPMIADELRRQADFFVDVVDLVKEFGRPQAFENETKADETQ